MSDQLERMGLRMQVREIIGFDGVFDEGEWYLVPAMLEWLRGRRWSLSIAQFETDEGWSTTADAWPPFPKIVAQMSGRSPDLPTALARLVLRVHALEQPAKGEGEKQ